MTRLFLILIAFVVQSYGAEANDISTCSLSTPVQVDKVYNTDSIHYKAIDRSVCSRDAEEPLEGNIRSLPMHNFYIASNFSSQGDNTIYFSTSIDGIHFQPINGAVIPSAASDAVSSRDPAITWFNDEWWVFGTGATEGSHDFVVYKGPDLFSLTKYKVSLGTGVYSSITTISGGTEPADAIWAPEPFIDGDTLYVAIAIRYGADYTDSYGNTARHFKMYTSECLNPDTMDFDDPEAVDFGTDTMSLIDMQVVKDGETYWAAVKDDNDKNIRIYSASSFLGTWTHKQTISDTDLSIEAPCLAPRYYQSEGSSTLNKTWRLYVDNNRTKAGTIDPNVLVGRPYFYELAASGNPGSAYGSIQKCYYPHSVRHGTIINLRDFPDAAFESVTRSFVAKTTGRPNLDKEMDLGSGDVTIRPQPEWTYYVNGTDTSVNLTIKDGPADRFYLAIYAADPETGITVLDAGRSESQFLVGYGRGSSSVIEMRRRVDGSYYPLSGGLLRSAFRVKKNSMNQTEIISSTNTPLMFDTEEYNFGGNYNALYSEYTPPKGRVDLNAAFLLKNAKDDTNTQIQIRMNGTVIATNYSLGSAGENVANHINLIGYPCSGTDVFTVDVRAIGAGPSGISVGGINSWFEGRSY